MPQGVAETDQAPAAASSALRLALGVALAAIALDQLSKWIILAWVMKPPRVIEVTGFFNLVLTFNTGVSFGILGGAATWKPWLLSLLALAIVAALLVWLRRQPEPLLALAVGLVAGGALGNVIDRVRFGAVVDFLDFYLGEWHWPAFNLADSAITVGVALLVFDGLFRAGRGGRNSDSAADRG